jgi:hypothetical protein
MKLIRVLKIGCAVFERGKEIFKAEVGAPAEPKFVAKLNSLAACMLSSPTP